MNLRPIALALLLVTLGCGAQSPITADAGEADVTDGSAADSGCAPVAHAAVERIGVRCVYRCVADSTGLRWGACPGQSGCDTPLNTVENCGGCGYSCRPPAVCTLGGDCYVP